MGVGQIIDAAIRLYRRSWKVFVAIVAWPLVPLALAQALAFRNVTPTLGSFNANNPPTTLGGAFSTVFPGHTAALLAAFSFIHYFLVFPFLTAAVSRAAGDMYLGRDVTVKQVYRVALGLFGAIVWVIVLVAFPVALGLLLVIPGIYLGVRLILSPIALMLEGARGGRALGRAWALTKGNWWRMFGLGLLTILLTYIVTAIAAVAFAILAHVAGPVGWVVSGVGSAAATVIVTPFTTIVLVLAYVDLRIRKEAFDLSILASQISRHQP